MKDNAKLELPIILYKLDIISYNAVGIRICDSETEKVRCPVIAYTAYRHMLWIADGPNPLKSNSINGKSINVAISLPFNIGFRISFVVGSLYHIYTG